MGQMAKTIFLFICIWILHFLYLECCCFLAKKKKKSVYPRVHLSINWEVWLVLVFCLWAESAGLCQHSLWYDVASYGLTKGYDFTGWWTRLGTGQRWSAYFGRDRGHATPAVELGVTGVSEDLNFSDCSFNHFSLTQKHTQ